MRLNLQQLRELTERLSWTSEDVRTVIDELHMLRAERRALRQETRDQRLALRARNREISRLRAELEKHARSADQKLRATS